MRTQDNIKKMQKKLYIRNKILIEILTIKY